MDQKKKTFNIEKNNGSEHKSYGNFEKRKVSDKKKKMTHNENEAAFTFDAD